MRPARTALVAVVAIAGTLGVAVGSTAQDRRSDRLRITFPSEDGSLTPYTFRNGYALMTLVYDTLTWRDAEGVPRPWLAQSVRRQGRTVMVRLCRGARWHDGRPLTAADVVFTYRYIATHRHPRFTLQLRDLASVTARGPRTVVFSLRRPSLGFEDQPLADVPILPQHLWANLAPGRVAPAGLPIGSGPYRLVDHTPGRGYTFAANDAYFKGRPLVTALEVPIVPSEEEAYDRLTTSKRASRVDLVPFTRPAGSISERSTRVEFDMSLAYSGTMLAFNLERPPFQRRDVRRAVAAAIDLRRIVGAVRGPAAMAPAARGALHPSSQWAAPRALHRHAPGAARVALAEQGVAPFAVLASSRDAVRREAARRVVATLRRAGAPAVLDVVSPEELDRALGRIGGTATFQAAVVGMPALASYDPAYLRTVFGDPQTAPLNDFGYRNPRFAQLDARVAAASTRAARRRAVAAQLALLARDLPALPLFFGGTTFAYRKLVYGNWVEVRGSGVLDKRSFLPGSRQAAADAAPVNADPRDTIAEAEGGSLVPFILGLAGLLFVAGAVWIVRNAGSASTRGGRRR